MSNEVICKPLISIVIPTYNGSEYIIEAIESVINQTYTNKEIIVIDDGSTDHTTKVIEPYLHKIRYFYQENQGASVARNRGIQESQGEFIALLDSDDFFLDANKLEDQIACFTAQPSFGVVHTGWQRVDRNGNKIVDRKPWLTAPNLDLETWLKVNPILPSAMMFRKNWLIKVGGFNPKLMVGEDVDLTFKLALMGCEMIWLKRVTVAYRQHEKNLTSQVLKCAETLPQILDDFFYLFEQSIPPASVYNRIMNLKDIIYYSHYVWFAWRFYSVTDFQKMAEYLDKSLSCSPYPLNLNATVWLESFNFNSQEEGKQFDSSNLIKSPEWQKLIKSILAKLIKQKKINQN